MEGKPVSLTVWAGELNFLRNIHIFSHLVLSCLILCFVTAILCGTTSFCLFALLTVSQGYQGHCYVWSFGSGQLKATIKFSISLIFGPFLPPFLLLLSFFWVSKCSRTRDEVSGLLSIKEKEDLSQLGTAGSNNENLYMIIKKDSIEDGGD